MCVRVCVCVCVRVCVHEMFSGLWNRASKHLLSIPASLQILICQNLRNNLQHPNEYIRGVTLRFLCRIREEEILEPLVPSILSNLEHRHSYVRRSAVLAINAIYKFPKGELLLQVGIGGFKKKAVHRICGVTATVSAILFL